MREKKREGDIDRYGKKERTLNLAVERQREGVRERERKREGKEMERKERERTPYLAVESPEPLANRSCFGFQAQMNTSES